ncbi:MAG: hypothetical protein QW505_01435 [Thermoplasmata archaeon]
MPDRSAIDTVFGALVLIVSCFACSSVVLLIDDGNPSDISRTVEAITEKFDLCLLSTITVDRKVMNTSIRESVQLLDYIALKLKSVEAGAREDFVLEEKQIEELFEFYFSWSKYWRLDMKIDSVPAISLMKQTSPAGSNVIVIERTIQISCDSLAEISFTIQL